MTDPLKIRIRSVGGSRDVDALGMHNLRTVIEAHVVLGQSVVIRVSEYGDAVIESEVVR
jgi:hypothetical protein